MREAELRSAVLAALASIAPDIDVQSLRPDQPLREQLDLDSMDWLNVVTALHDRLAIDIPESDYDKVATLDGIVAYLGAARRRHPPHALRATAPAPDDLPCERHEINGTAVTIRPIRHDDTPLEADFVRHLSDDARYMRFMSTIRELPPGKLKYLVDVDHVRHVALVAVADIDGKPVEVGVVRYIVDPAGTGCEFSVAIDDAWHHTGLAGILMAALMDVARKRGLARMEGIVLAINASMLRFARQLGFTLEHDPEDRTTMRVVREL
jgi:acetyltransferase